MKKKPIIQVAGLHLWECKVNRSDMVYWITTERNDPIEATRKMKRFIREHPGELYGKTIHTVISHGTIDA